MKFEIRFYPLIIFILITSNAYAGLFTSEGPEEEEGRHRANKSGAIRKAEEEFLKGNYKEAVNVCGKYTSDSKHPDERICYLAGSALLKLRRYDESRRYFEMILENSQSNGMQNAAYVGIGDSYCLAGKYEEAMDVYDKSLRYYPNKSNASAVYYGMYQCCRGLNDAAKADEYKNKVLSVYPASIEAALLRGGQGPEVPDTGGYMIQLGVFKNRANAERLSGELQGRGYRPAIIKSDEKGGRYYRVRIGPYQGRDKVEAESLKLRNMGFPTQVCQ